MAVAQCPSLQKQRTKDRLSDILERDEETKKNLVEIYNDVKLLLSEEPDAKLNKEISVQYQKYKTQLDEYPKSLQEDERPIVITGETGAGKSSILNLLLEVDLFPTSMLPCTGTVCRLRTSETKKAVVIDFNETIVKTIEMEGSDENKFKKDLKDYVNPKKKRRGEHNIKFVDIYWPISFLRKSIIVVDTPGSGENNETTERLIEYLPNAVALIYVIDPTKAGGIVEDRIVPLFEAIKGQDNNGMKHAFDPSCALFLCNKWDVVDESEEDEVWEHIKTKLRDYWPTMQDKQLHRFSAKEIWLKMRKHQKTPEEFINFRRVIDELILVSLGAKSRQHIRWLQEFVMTIKTNIKSHLKYTTLSESQRAEILERSKELLKMLEDCRRTSKGKLQQRADDTCQKLAKLINSDLHDRNDKGLLFSFTDRRLPDNGDLAQVFAEVSDIIQDVIRQELLQCYRKLEVDSHLQALLQEFEKEKKYVADHREKLRDIFPKRSEMNEKGSESSSDDEISSSGDEISLNRNIGDMKMAVMAVFIPLWAPFAFVGGLVALPILAGRSIVNKIKASFSHSQLQKYRSNKEKFATQWANDYLNTFTERSLTVLLQENSFTRFYEEFNEYFDKTLPQMICGSKQLFENLQTELRNRDSIRKCYQPKLDKCKQIRRNLKKLSSTSTFC